MRAIVEIKTWKIAKEGFRKYVEDTSTNYIFEANDLDEAIEKVVTSFAKDHLVGFNVRMENGDFMCTCVPEYYEYKDVLGVDFTKDPEKAYDEVYKSHLKMLKAKKTAKNDHN